MRGTSEGMLSLHKRRKRLLAALLVTLGLILVDYALYPFLPGPPGPGPNRGENGLWLRSDWYLGRHSRAEIVALGPRLREAQIRYAYFHVRQISGNGALRIRAAGPARQLTDGLHRTEPSVKLLAWVYVGNVRRAPG